jgi:hypothetical protein
MSPRPFAKPLEFPKEFGGAEWLEFQRKRWESHYRTFQIYDEKNGSHLDFTLEVEHPKIIQEAFHVIEAIILHE